MATRLSSEDWIPQFSEDGGTTWLTLICPTSWEFTGSSDTTTTQTLTCGPVTSVSSFGASGSAEAICDVSPSASQVSAKKALSWADARTPLKFKATAGTGGADLFVSGDAVISNYSLNSQAGEYLQFSVQWTIENLDITP